MALSKIKGTVIADNAINADRIADGTVVASDLLDNTLTGAKLATDIAITTSGNITTTGAFTSTGIDDNATSTAITIDSSQNVGIAGNINLGDNDKAQFGASNDLQIYHNGSASYIKEAGTGNLSIGGDNEVYITNSADNEFKARFITDGAVELYYDNSKKFETTSTGATVTGNLTASGNLTSLGIDDNATSTAITIDSSENVGIGATISSTGATSPKTIIASTSEQLLLQGTTNGTGQSVDLLFEQKLTSNETRVGGKISSIATGSYTAGSISTYDSALVFYSASNNVNRERMRIDNSGNVLVGKTSSSAFVDGVTLNSGGGYFSATNNRPLILNRNGSDGSLIEFYKDGSSSLNLRTISGGLEFSSGSTGYLNILSNGNVGINQTSPTEKLHVTGNVRANNFTNRTSIQGVDATPNDANNFELGAGYLNLYRDSTAEVNQIQFGKNGTLAAAFSTGADYLAIKTNGDTERMRINSAGAVSIGSSNVIQNSHLNVRQDDNSHATRTYLQARVQSGAFYSIKYLGTIPVVSSGTQLIIPFISQGNINSKTYVHIRGMSCEYNTSDPKAFDVKFSVGHISSLGTPTVLQNLGTCTGVSKSGMNVVLQFNTNYQHSIDNGVFIEIDYITHHQDASIDLSGIVMN